MKIRKRDAITISRQFIYNKKKAKHFLDRLSRYKVEEININNIDEVFNFLINYIESSDVFFSYFEMGENRTKIVELPGYIIDYIKHIEILKERRSNSKYLNFALPVFAKKEDTIFIPPNTYTYMYIVNDIYSLVACVEIKGKISLNPITTYNRIFNFSSITFLSFEEASSSVIDTMKNKNLRIFNRVIIELLYSFSEQNDFYDDLLLQGE